MSDRDYEVSTAADAVSAGAGIYARSSSEHLLSGLCDKMPWRPDILSGHEHAVSNVRNTMSGLYNAVSDRIRALSGWFDL